MNLKEAYLRYCWNRRAIGVLHFDTWLQVVFNEFSVNN